MSVSERTVLPLPQGDDEGSAGENDSLRTTQLVTGPEEKVQAPSPLSFLPHRLEEPTRGGGVAIAWATLRFPYWVSFDSHTIQFWTWKMSMEQRKYSLQRPLPCLCLPAPVARPGAGQAGRGSFKGQMCRGLGGQAVCPLRPAVSAGALGPSLPCPSQASFSAGSSTRSPCWYRLLLCVSWSPSSRKSRMSPQSSQVGRRERSRNRLPAWRRLSVETFLDLQLRHLFPMRHS